MADLEDESEGNLLPGRRPVSQPGALASPRQRNFVGGPGFQAAGVFTPLLRLLKRKQWWACDNVRNKSN